MLLVSYLVSKNKLKDYFVHLKEFKVVFNIKKYIFHLFIKISNLFLTLFFQFFNEKQKKIIYYNFKIFFHFFRLNYSTR